MKQHRKNKKNKQHNNVNNLPENNNEYFKDLETWMENRYNPGFYTGGQIPPYIKYPKKPIGFVFLVSGLIGLFYAYLARLSGSDTLGVVVAFIFSLLSMVAGFFIITNKRT